MFSNTFHKKNKQNVKQKSIGENIDGKQVNYIQHWSAHNSRTVAYSSVASHELRAEIFWLTFTLRVQ